MRPRYVTMAVAGLAVAGASAALTWWFAGQPMPNPVPILTRLTSDSGLTTDPALSPDGKWLAFASDRSGDGNLDIWLQQVGRGETIRLTTDPADDSEPAFSPDGTRIVFRSDRGGGGLYVVSTLGGAATKIADRGRGPRFSPDGRWIAYWVAGTDFSSAAASRIYVVAATGGAPRRFQPDLAVSRFPVWSPDGRQILFLGDRDPNPNVAETWDWWVAPLEGGPAVRTGALAALRKHGLPDARSPTKTPSRVLIPSIWTAENRLIFTADLADSRNIWDVGISPRDWRVTESPQRLTFGAGTEDLPSTTATGRQIAFSDASANVDIWSLPLDHRYGTALGEPRRLTESLALDVQPAISANGQRLVFASSRAGNFDIWLKDLRTGEETAVTISSRFESKPAISADGSEVAYNDWPGPNPVVHVLSLDGRSGEAIAAKVCDDCFLPWDWSPDKKTLLYWSRDLKQVGALDVASREKAIILKHPEYAVLRSQFSPNGRWIAFEAILGPDQVQLFVAPFQGMSTIRHESWIAVTGGEVLNVVPRWSPDGNILYFLSSRDGYLCLWGQRLDPETKRPGGEAKPVYHLHGARRSISGVPGSLLETSVARDKIVFPVSERSGNIWMVEWKQ